MAKTIVDGVANDYLDALFGSGAPATWYLALYTAMPADDGSGGTEVSTGGYSRLAVTNNNTNFPDASARAKSNGADFEWSAASGANWGTILGVGFHELSTGGTPDYKKLLVSSIVINDGDTFRFSTGQLTISVP